MSDLINRQVLMGSLVLSDKTGGFTCEQMRAVLEVVQAQPPAQPEIIRCRECKHYYFADNRIPQEQRYVCDIGGEIWQPDDFCSYGERREVSE